MTEPKREEVEGWPGVAVLEFGASWCPICSAARPTIDRALAEIPGVRHVWVEDGPGRPLGRSYRVKLWPTLVLLRDGVEVARVVRPQGDADLRELVARASDSP
jgi:thioredoxin 1